VNPDGNPFAAGGCVAVPAGCVEPPGIVSDGAVEMDDKADPGDGAKAIGSVVASGSGATGGASGPVDVGVTVPPAIGKAGCVDPIGCVVAPSGGVGATGAFATGNALFVSVGSVG